MRRTLTAVTSQLLSVVFCFLPAFGQQLFTPSRASVHRFGRLAGRTTEASSTGEPIPAIATPVWTPFSQLTNHTGLDGPSAVYDPSTNTMIAFGGVDAGLGLDVTNAVLLRANANGSGAWSTLIDNGAAGSPPARAYHTAVYDAANNRMIVFGGCTGSFALGGCTTNFNDVWVLSGANGMGGTPAWTQLSPTGTPPDARELHTAVYDAANNRMTIFGGETPNDSWVLSNANGMGGTPAWTKLSPTGGPPKGTVAASAVYDPANNIMTVFGGANPLIADTNAVWTLSHANGLGGTPHWTNIVANGALGSPAKRDAHTATYDVANNRMTIFGGLNEFASGFVGFNDAWVLSNANGLGGTPAWTKLNPTGVKPGVRWFHTAVYDAVNNLMIVFAGVNLDAQFYITWVLSDANGL